MTNVECDVDDCEWNREMFSGRRICLKDGISIDNDGKFKDKKEEIL